MFSHQDVLCPIHTTVVKLLKKLLSFNNKWARFTGNLLKNLESEDYFSW